MCQLIVRSQRGGDEARSESGSYHQLPSVTIKNEEGEEKNCIDRVSKLRIVGWAKGIAKVVAFVKSVSLEACFGDARRLRQLATLDGRMRSRAVTGVLVRDHTLGKDCHTIATVLSTVLFSGDG